MNGKNRREKILQLLSLKPEALSGKYLASQLEVSRQVIVQDIALLRANGAEIISTNLGYLLMKKQETSRVFKVHHSEEDMEEELCLIVDCGGAIRDVFVYHKVYGTIKAAMNIYTRDDIYQFKQEITTGKSSLLLNITAGYHYHTVTASDEAVLDRIQDKLREKGFLAKLQDYEPVNFWEKTC